ncbi:MAG TPA: hypothetical protein VF759_08310 [Allosphingosinicella sp.]|jgi:hypothetical protein
MKRLSLIPLLALAACAGGRSEPVSLVKRPLYQAVGGPPGWTLSVGRERIVLRLSPDPSEGPDAPAIVREYPSPRFGFGHGVKRWDAGSGTQAIAIEARRTPCRNGSVSFQDEVRVRFGRRELAGCGGRIRPGGRR